VANYKSELDNMVIKKQKDGLERQLKKLKNTYLRRKDGQRLIGWKKYEILKKMKELLRDAAMERDHTTIGGYSHRIHDIDHVDRPRSSSSEVSFEDTVDRPHGETKDITSGTGTCNATSRDDDPSYAARALALTNWKNGQPGQAFKDTPAGTPGQDKLKYPSTEQTPDGTPGQYKRKYPSTEQPPAGTPGQYKRKYPSQVEQSHSGSSLASQQRNDELSKSEGAKEPIVPEYDVPNEPIHVTEPSVPKKSHVSEAAEVPTTEMVRNGRWICEHAKDSNLPDWCQTGCGFENLMGHAKCQQCPWRKK